MTGAAPAVSVVLPCYNAHRYLTRALDSVRAQSFSDYEIIVVDDGSTDSETTRYLDSLPSDIRVIRQENRGLPGARNAGFKHARGRYVLPLDCDDWLEPSFLEKAVAALSACNSETTFVFSHLVMEGDKKGTLVKHFNLFEQLCANQLPYCLLLNRTHWEKLGGYDETMRHGYEDWEFNIRLAAGGAEAIVISEPLFHYSVSASGMLISHSRKRHGILWREIQQRHPDLYRMNALVQLWRKWRTLPSTRPLWTYFPLLVAHRILPDTIFAWLFGRAMKFSHSVKIQQAEARRASA